MASELNRLTAFIDRKARGHERSSARLWSWLTTSARSCSFHPLSATIAVQRNPISPEGCTSRRAAVFTTAHQTAKASRTVNGMPVGKATMFTASSPSPAVTSRQGLALARYAALICHHPPGKGTPPRPLAGVPCFRQRYMVHQSDAPATLEPTRTSAPHPLQPARPAPAGPTVLEAQPEGLSGGGAQRTRRPGWSEAEAW